MVKRSPRRPRPAPAGGRKPRRQRATTGLGWRVYVALGLLAVAVAVVLLLVRRRPPTVELPPPAAPIEVVREVAARLHCPAQRVSEESPTSPDRPLVITVSAPRGFPVADFTRKIEAAAHNSGGRLEPRPLAETGGYGLARLDGTLRGRRVRILVLGEEPRPTPAPRARTEHTADLAIVLDDAGYSLPEVEKLADLPRSVAVAVLPNAPQSRAVAEELARQGREVLLHMPMEPLPNPAAGPGEGAVLVGQSPAEVERRLERALEVVPMARGINNHMGSRATADLATMQAVMAFVRRRGLYFLDSRTTPATVAEQTARAAGVPALRRDVFLDNVDEPDAVRRCLDDAVARARLEGSTLAIGHVHPTTIAVLEAELRSLPAGVRLVRPSQLLGSAATLEAGTHEPGALKAR